MTWAVLIPSRPGSRERIEASGCSLQEAIGTAKSMLLGLDEPVSGPSMLVALVVDESPESTQGLRIIYDVDAGTFEVEDL